MLKLAVSCASQVEYGWCWRFIRCRCMHFISGSWDILLKSCSISWPTKNQINILRSNPFNPFMIVVFKFVFFRENVTMEDSDRSHSLMFNSLLLHHIALISLLFSENITLSAFYAKSVFLSPTICWFSDWKLIRWSPGRRASLRGPRPACEAPWSRQFPDRHLRLSQESQHAPGGSFGEIIITMDWELIKSTYISHTELMTCFRLSLMGNIMLLS